MHLLHASACWGPLVTAAAAAQPAEMPPTVVDGRVLGRGELAVCDLAGDQEGEQQVGSSDASERYRSAGSRLQAAALRAAPAGCAERHCPAG